MLAENTFAGLTVLQIGLVSLALLIIAMNVYSGWRNGIVRQILRIFAILGAYLVGFYFGPVVAPLIPLGQVEGAAKNTVVSILVGFAAYLIMRLVINILFRKTSEQDSGMMRWIYGIGGGTVGLFFSVFFLIIFLIGIRLTGTVADAQLRVAERRHEKPPETRGVVMTQLSKARQAIETGPVAPIVETVDPSPPDLYKNLDKIATMTADPEAMGRFMSYPGTRQLMQQPSLKKLADDPRMQAMAQKKDFLGIGRDPRVAELFQDGALRDQLKKFEFFKALDFALTAPPHSDPAKTPDLPPEPSAKPLVY